MSEWTILDDTLATVTDTLDDLIMASMSYGEPLKAATVRAFDRAIENRRITPTIRRYVDAFLDGHMVYDWVAFEGTVAIMEASKTPDAPSQVVTHAHEMQKSPQFLGGSDGSSDDGEETHYCDILESVDVQNNVVACARSPNGRGGRGCGKYYRVTLCNDDDNDGDGIPDDVPDYITTAIKNVWLIPGGFSSVESDNQTLIYSDHLQRNICYITKGYIGIEYPLHAIGVSIYQWVDLDAYPRANNPSAGDVAWFLDALASYHNGDRSPSVIESLDGFKSSNPMYWDEIATQWQDDAKLLEDYLTARAHEMEVL